MKKQLAPIVIFAFNRPLALTKMIESLKKNDLFDDSEIFVFVDGARNSQEQEKVNRVIDIAKSLTKNVVASKENKGLGPSVIQGISEIINRYGKIIVLEDDLKLMPGFLTYINQALNKYETSRNIFSVCGYGLKIHKPNGYKGDVYLNNRSSSWGWGTWKDRWNSVDWEIKDWDQLIHNQMMQRAFNKGGSDMYGMLKDYMEGRNKSWAIRFCYSQFKQKKYSVHPFLSLVDNEGFGVEATNCKQHYSRFKILLNQNNTPLDLPDHLIINSKLLKENAFYHSLLLRTYSFIRNFKNRVMR